MSRKHFQDFSVDNIKKTGLNGYDYDFTVDYDAIAVDDILDIRKYLMKKNGMIKNVQACKSNNCFSNSFFDCNELNLSPLKCVSMNTQECQKDQK